MAALLMMAPEAFLLPPSSFVAQPLSTRQATRASSSGVSMMSLVPLDRRAALAELKVKIDRDSYHLRTPYMCV